MIKDPKQIITPFAFEVHPDLLGLPLATPKRRLAALLLDLLIASILTALGAFFLATSASILFFWLAIRNRGKVWWKNFFRYAVASFISILVFALTLNVTKDEDDFITPTLSNTSITNDSTNIPGDVDWMKFGKAFVENEYADSAKTEALFNELEKTLESAFGASKNDSNVKDEFYNELKDSSFLPALAEFQLAVHQDDTSKIDSLSEKLGDTIAKVELNRNRTQISALKEKVSSLSDKNEELQEIVDNPTFLRSIKAASEDFGLSLGWIGIYFVLCTALFKGQTLGKRIFSLRVIRLNNKPIGLLYSFERFGGYAAGIATGLLGFAQVYWDANRQGIHDKIAATVVVDTRKKVIEKYESLRQEILTEENLLD